MQWLSSVSQAADSSVRSVRGMGGASRREGAEVQAERVPGLERGWRAGCGSGSGRGSGAGRGDSGHR